MIQVVHVRQVKIPQYTPGFIYIGRDYAEFEDEGWGNHFHIGPDGTREEVLLKYRAWALAQSNRWRWNAYLTLKDKTLGCWCKPLSCHGDVLVEVISMIQRIEDPKIFVGLSYEDAKQQIIGRGYSHRLTSVDGFEQRYPHDGYDPLRITLKVKSNRISEAVIG